MSSSNGMHTSMTPIRCLTLSITTILEDRIKHSITCPCPCNNLFIPSTSSDQNENQINFKKDWNQELLKNKPELKQIEISHECTYAPTDRGNNVFRWFNKYPPSKSFTNELVQLLNSIPKLSRLLVTTYNSHNIVLEVLKSTNQLIDDISICPVEENGVFEIEPTEAKDADANQNEQEINYSNNPKYYKSIFESIFNDRKYIKNLTMYYVSIQKQANIFDFKRK